MAADEKDQSQGAPPAPASESDKPKKSPPKKREAVIDTTDATQGAPPAPLAPASPAPTRPHHTRCKVVGSAVVAPYESGNGSRTYEVGEVAEFADSDVLSLPEFLIPEE